MIMLFAYLTMVSLSMYIGYKILYWVIRGIARLLGTGLWLAFVLAAALIGGGVWLLRCC